MCKKILLFIWQFIDFITDLVTALSFSGSSFKCSNGQIIDRNSLKPERNEYGYLDAQEVALYEQLMEYQTLSYLLIAVAIFGLCCGIVSIILQCINGYEDTESSLTFLCCRVLFEDIISIILTLFFIWNHGTTILSLISIVISLLMLFREVFIQCDPKTRDCDGAACDGLCHRSVLCCVCGFLALLIGLILIFEESGVYHENGDRVLGFSVNSNDGYIIAEYNIQNTMQLRTNEAPLFTHFFTYYEEDTERFEINSYIPEGGYDYLECYSGDSPTGCRRTICMDNVAECDFVTCHYQDVDLNDLNSECRELVRGECFNAGEIVTNQKFSNSDDLFICDCEFQSGWIHIVNYFSK
eukprot:259306_1